MIYGIRVRVVKGRALIRPGLLPMILMRSECSGRFVQEDCKLLRMMNMTMAMMPRWCGGRPVVD